MGFNNAADSERLGDVSVAYNQLDVDTLAPEYLNIAVHYENGETSRPSLGKTFSSRPAHPTEW